MDDLQREVISHGWELKSLKESAVRFEASLMDLRRDVGKLEDQLTEMERDFGKWVAAAEATQRHAEKIANQAITAKQLYISTGLLIVAILGLVLGFKA